MPAMKPLESGALVVVVVDDDQMILRTITALLEAVGFDVLPTTSAAEAMQIVTACRPDAVLTDLQMPEMDGVELAHALQRETPEVPVVVMTGAPSVENVGAARRAGAVGVLSKPLDAPLLLSTLDGAIAARRAVGSPSGADAATVPA